MQDCNQFARNQLDSYGIHSIETILPDYEEKLGGINTTTFVNWIQVNQLGYLPDPESLSFFRNSINNLSSKAKDIISLVLNVPPDYVSFLYFLGKKRVSSFTNHRNIRKYLVKMKGWKNEDVNKAYKEILKTLSE